MSRDSQTPDHGEPLVNAAGKEPVAIVKQRRLLNRWGLFALFFITATATVLYVSNVIAVNKLSAEVDVYRKQCDSLETLNKSLRTEAYKLQGSERITRIAADKLGMIPPPEAPVVIKE
ncbi:MAG: cell division protein FtsL [Bradyrhizobiaceae bacterium]|nr:cell division protein FtsL [Bradyrhizobiaceae bacterium]